MQNKSLIESRNENAEEECRFLKEYLSLTLGQVLKSGFYKMLENKAEDYVDFLADHLFENADFSPAEEKLIQALVELNK